MGSSYTKKEQGDSSEEHTEQGASDSKSGSTSKIVDKVASDSDTSQDKGSTSKTMDKVVSDSDATEDKDSVHLCSDNRCGPWCKSWVECIPLGRKEAC